MGFGVGVGAFRNKRGGVDLWVGVVWGGFIRTWGVITPGGRPGYRGRAPGSWITGGGTVRGSE